MAQRYIEERFSQQTRRAWKRFLPIYVAVVLMLFIGRCAMAGEATIVCTVKPERTDGTLLNEPAGVLFSYGTSPTQLTRTWKNAKTGDCTATIKNLAVGVWYFSAIMYTDSGEKSPPSSIISKEVKPAALATPVLE